MIIYYVIILIALIIMFLNDINTSFEKRKYDKFIRIIFLFFLFIFIGLRYKVGSDWNTYNDIFFLDGLQSKNYEIGYYFIIYVSKFLELNIFGLNIFASFIFFLGFFSLFKDEKYFWFAINLSLPYLFLVVAMGYTRQSIAIGFGMLIFKSLIKSNKLNQLFFLFLALMFHYTSIIYSFFIFYNIRSFLLKFICFIVVIFLLFLLTDQFSDLSRYYKYYYAVGRDSFGGLPRLLLASIPSLIFIFNFKHIRKSNYNNLFETYTILIALLWILVFISSTSADRLLLYLLPLKVFLFLKILDFIMNKYLFIYLYTFIFILSFYIHSLFSLSFQDSIPYQNFLAITQYSDTIFSK